MVMIYSFVSAKNMMCIFTCSFLRRQMPMPLFVGHNHHALPEVPTLHDVQERLPGVLKPADDVLLVLDLPAGDTRRERPVELVLVLGHERADEETVERDLAPHELLEVLDVVCFRVVPGNVAADLQQCFMRNGRGCARKGLNGL